MPILLKNFILIDGINDYQINDYVILIIGPILHYVGPLDQLIIPGCKSCKSCKLCKSCESEIIVLDLQEKYVLPGLIDTHVHLSGSGETDCQYEDRRGGQGMILKMLSNAQKNLKQGITTIRDLGGWDNNEFVLRDWMQRNEYVGPRMCLAGKYISITESGSDSYTGMYEQADGVDEILKAVRRQVKMGADVIKMGVTGAILVKHSAPGSTHFNDNEIIALISEAKKFNLPVAVHAHGIDGIKKAVHAGARTIEHGTFLHQDIEVIKEMSQKQTFLVPTLRVHDVDKSNVSDWIKKKTLTNDAILSIRKCYENDVLIANGSDAGTPLNYHNENVKEINMMYQALLGSEKKILPIQVIGMATRNSARAIGWDHLIGTLVSGKLADLIVHNKNPLHDLEILSDPQSLEFVMQNGIIVASRSLSQISKSICSKHMLNLDIGSKL